MGLEELRIDFAMNRGHEMIVDRAAGIAREQLDEVEIRMLQGQRIPRLLPVEWIDIDGRVTFHYSLEGKRMLSHKLQSQPLSMIDFYALLLAIVEAIDDSQHFMLRPVGFMLHEQYIFTGEQWQDIGLAYLPLRSEGAVDSADETVLAMAVRWIGYIEQPDGTGLQQVFQHLKGGHVAWNALRQTLITLISGVHFDGAGTSGTKSAVRQDAQVHFSQEEIKGMRGASGTRNASRQNSQPQREASPDRGEAGRGKETPVLGEGFRGKERSNGGENYRGKGMPDPGSRGTSEAEAARADYRPDSESAIPKPGGQSAAILPFIRPGSGKDGGARKPESASFDETDNEPPLTELEPEQGETAKSRPKWLAGAAFVVAVALIWRYLYLASPGRSSLLISLGLTVMAGAGALFYWKRTASSDEDSEDEWPQKGKWTAAEEEQFLPNSSQRSRRAAEQAEEFRELAASMPEEAERQAAVRMTSGETFRSYAEPAFPIQGGRSFSASANQEVTVLLGSGNPGSIPGKRIIPWLERNTAGQVDKLEIQSELFVIGRSAEGAHHVDESKGISRSHIELSAGDPDWTVKDMGSRNGSALNGEAMISYKSYPLHDGDLLQLAGEKGPKYIFRRPQ